MATRPTPTPNWADDTNYPAGAEAWSGTATKVEPSTGAKEDGWVPNTQPPAQWFNWLFNILSRWIAYFAAIIDSSEEHTYQVAKPQRVLISVADMQSQLSSFSITEWRLLVGSSGWTTNADSPILLIPLNAYLRHGMVITDLRVIVTPGIARAGVNRMSLELFYLPTDHNVVSFNPLAPVSVGGPVYDNGGITDQAITIGSVLGGGHTVVKEGTGARDYYAVVKGGNNALGNVDILYGALINWNNPGPRNA